MFAQTCHKTRFIKSKYFFLSFLPLLVGKWVFYRPILAKPISFVFQLEMCDFSSKKLENPWSSFWPCLKLENYVKWVFYKAKKKRDTFFPHWFRFWTIQTLFFQNFHVFISFVPFIYRKSYFYKKYVFEKEKSFRSEKQSDFRCKNVTKFDEICSILNNLW